MLAAFAGPLSDWLSQPPTGASIKPLGKWYDLITGVGGKGPDGLKPDDGTTGCDSTGLVLLAGTLRVVPK